MDNKGFNMKNNKAKFDEQAILSEALGRYEDSNSAEGDQRDKCLEDMQFAFVPGSQWDTKEASSRKDRPRFEINKLVLPINQAIGDQRQNRISIKVRPSQGAATKEMAEVYNGLVRYIENKSNFKDTKDNTFKEVVSGGFGGWYVTTEYTGRDSFDQDIVIKSIRSAASSIFYDTSAQDELKRDANWFLVTEDMNRKTFEKRYPGKAASDLQNTASASLKQWQSRDTVRVADYWVKEPITIELALLSDGRVIELDKDTNTVLDELALSGVTVVRTRKRQSHKIKMYKISAGAVLEGPFDWAGEYIPVVPVFGYNCWINGQHYYQGMVRNARDPQRVYNYATSQMIEASALSPKDPFWITPKQAQGHATQLANFNVRNTPFMFYNPDLDAPGAPQRTGAPSVQSALIQQVQQAENDVMSSTGQFQPSLGDQVNDQSGRAILALQRKGHAATHELNDNLAKAVQYTGTILLDLIPKIYDTQRQISILGEDGSATPIILNDIMVDTQTGQEVTVNDLSQGTYDVVADSGPSYQTQRTENLNLLFKLSESNPLFAQTATDLIAKSIDFNYSEELTKRIRQQMLQQGLVSPNEEEQEAMSSQSPPQPSPTELLQFELLKLQVEQQAGLVDNLELQNEKLKADTLHKTATTVNTYADVLKTQAETDETLTQSFKNKADAAESMNDAGLPAVIEMNSSEIAARQGNLRNMNSQLEITELDLERLREIKLQEYVKTNVAEAEAELAQVQAQGGETVDDDGKILRTPSPLASTPVTPQAPQPDGIKPKSI